ncbi:hypothetical protein RJ641_008563 [Dillenia turbinata]|uniref:Ubiquitin-like protease family profile domain-containing protein n=1 Tax=Dillenia turbinata TaxID=194707 RepID=A0AAN8V555_9MAGN
MEAGALRSCRGHSSTKANNLQGFDVVKEKKRNRALTAAIAFLQLTSPSTQVSLLAKITSPSTQGARHARMSTYLYILNAPANGFSCWTALNVFRHFDRGLKGLFGTLMDKKILSYNDVVLRQSDLGILGGPFYLNDRIIEFYFSYLSSCYSSKEILLVPPSIAFWIANCPDTESLGGFLEPLKLSEKEVVIFPVNDNDDVSQAEGGSHWSLLAFNRTANDFVHHDSCRAIARAICCWYESCESKDKEDMWFSSVKEISPSTVGKMRTKILELIKQLMAKN